MCSKGLSVWFACKLCKSFFLNADDFAYHKKKSHVQEFRNTKFIVFEEQNSSPASPPENWVSFLSPKEETRIHTIISLPLSTTTATNYKIDCNPSNENHHSIRNDEFIVNDLESNKDFIFNNQDGRPGDANQKQDKHCTSIVESALKNKSSSLKIRKEKIQNISSNPSQAVIQSPHNPFVYLKRLKSTSSFADVKEVTPKTEVESEMCLTNEENQSSATNLPLCENLDGVCIADCKPNLDHDVVSSNYNDAWEENIGEIPNSSRNISKDPFFSESILPDVTTSKIVSNSVLFKCKFCCKKLKSDNFQTHVKDCKNLYSNHDQQSNLSVNQNQRFHSDHIDLVKMEFTEETEDIEFPLTGVDTDPFESESQIESLAEEILYVATSSFSNNSSDGNLEEVAAPERPDPQMDFSRYCISCQKYFASIQDLKFHSWNYHGTQDGKRNFQCPHPNCEKTTKSQSHLRMHLIQVHSAARPFVCPHPNCSLSFKTSSNRNKHAKKPHLNTTSGVVEVFNTLEATIANIAPASSTTNSDSEIAPAIDFSRHCVACQLYFVDIQELRSHNQNFHRTQEGHLSYKCPYSNCGETTDAQYDLRIHLKQAHSSDRPFKCPHPNCKMSFKIIGDRNRHVKCHTKLKGNK